MEFEQIKSLSYEHLIRNLPKIVSSFALSIRESKGKLHRWNRMHNRKLIMNASIPKEIEEYIINKIKDIDEFLVSQISIVSLIKISWYISHIPFENALIELMNEFIIYSKDKIEKNAIIIIKNLGRNKNRGFDTFYAGDLTWLLGVYFNSIIKGSRLICDSEMSEELLFLQNDNFPIKYNHKDVSVSKNKDIVDNIHNYKEIDYVIHITTVLGNPENYYKNFDRRINESMDIGKPSIILWELRPYLAINQENYNINYIQGFSEKSFQKIEDIIESKNYSVKT
jgi:hypothetical protein